MQDYPAPESRRPLAGEQRVQQAIAPGSVVIMWYHRRPSLVAEAGLLDGRPITDTFATDQRTYRYGWDALGRLRSIEHPDGRVTQLDVDALGRLAAVGGTRIVWDPTDPVTQPVRIADTTVHRAADQLVGVATEDTVSWTETDWRGSPTRADDWGWSPAGDATLSFPGFLGEIEVEGRCSEDSDPKQQIAT